MQLAEDCVRADNAVKELEDKLEEAKKHRELVRAILFDELIGSGVEAVEVFVDGVVCRVSPKAELRASIIPHEYDEWLKYCETTKIGFGDEQYPLLALLAKLTFNDKTLSSYVKKEFLGDRAVPHVQAFFQPGIRISRKQPKSTGEK